MTAAARHRAALIARIGHPKWSPAAYLELLRHREAHRDFVWIADHMGRTRLEVEGRWHRLRVIPGIAAKLAELRPAARAYQANRGKG